MGIVCLHMLNGCLGIYHLSLVSFFSHCPSACVCKGEDVGFSFLIVQRLGSIFLEMVAQKKQQAIGNKRLLILLECPKKKILAIVGCVSLTLI